MAGRKKKPPTSEAYLRQPKVTQPHTQGPTRIKPAPHPVSLTTTEPEEEFLTFEEYLRRQPKDTPTQDSQKIPRKLPNPFTATWRLTKEYAAYCSLGEIPQKPEVADDSSSSLLHCLWKCCYAICEIKAELMKSGRAPWDADWSKTILLFNDLYKALSPSVDTSIWMSTGVSGNLSMTLQSSILALNLAMEQMVQMTNLSGKISVDDVKKRFSLIEQLWTIRTLRVREEEKGDPSVTNRDSERDRNKNAKDDLALSSIWTLLRSVIFAFMSPNEDNKKLVDDHKMYLERVRDGENWVFQSCWEVCKVLGERATSEIWCPNADDDLYFQAYAPAEKVTTGGDLDTTPENEFEAPPFSNSDPEVVPYQDKPLPPQDNWDGDPCVSSNGHAGLPSISGNTAGSRAVPVEDRPAEEWSSLGTAWCADQTYWPARPGSSDPGYQWHEEDNAGTTIPFDEPPAPCSKCSTIDSSDIEAIHYIRLRILVLRAAIACGWSSTHEKSFTEFLREMPATSFGETKALKVLFHTYRRIMLASSDSIKDRGDKLILEATVERVKAAVEWKTQGGKFVFLRDLFKYVVGVEVEEVGFLSDKLKKRLVTAKAGQLPA